MPWFTFKRAPGGGYDVYDRTDGKCVGGVRRMSIAPQWWFAYRPDGECVINYMPTRDAAAERLRTYRTDHSAEG